jgi:RimJ/RimL family protein N-acetyltransferase
MPALPLLDPPLSDGEVTFRPWRERDAAALAALCQDETIVRWTNVSAGYTEHMARARITEAEADRRAGRALVLAVVAADTDELLGGCDLRLAENDPHHAEVAYMLGEAARGRGVMTQAVHLLSRWAIEGLGVAQIEIFTHPENPASIAVAERAGFVRESLLRGYRVKKGRREDRVVLSLAASGLWS